MLLPPSEFITQLQNLFISTRAKGNITVTQKSYNGKTKPTPKPNPKFKGKTGGNNKLETEDLSKFDKVLIRAKTSQNKKISTVVNQQELLEFNLAYCQLLRKSMDGLKKKDKKRTNKNKSKTKIAASKQAAGDGKSAGKK